MRSFGLIALLALSLALPGSHARADLSVGLSVGDQGLDSFYLAVGNYFHYPRATVLAVRQECDSDDDLPVVLCLARRAHVRPQVILSYRREGVSWLSIARRYRLQESAFCVPEKGVSRTQWSRTYLVPERHWGDGDVREVVNRRFSGYRPERRERGDGRQTEGYGRGRDDGHERQDRDGRHDEGQDRGGWHRRGDQDGHRGR